MRTYREITDKLINYYNNAFDKRLVIAKIKLMIEVGEYFLTSSAINLDMCNEITESIIKLKEISQTFPYTNKMTIRINDLIFWAWVSSGFSFIIAMLVPQKFWYIIWFSSLAIPFLIWQVILLIKGIISYKSGGAKK